MLPSTSSFTSVPHEIISNLHYSRRLLLHTPFFHSPATTQSPSPNDQVSSTSSNDGSNHDSFDANVVMVLAVLICAVICSLFANSLIKFVIKCSRLLREPNYYLNIVNHQKMSTGVDKKALKSFPVVKYSSEKNIQGLGTECVICLSDFQEGEKVRILPKCNHGFHIKCIDKWLSSHSSCPYCRQCLVDISQKNGRCDQEHQASTTSAPAIASAEVIPADMIAISIVPLKRENMVRNYREHTDQS